MHKSKIKLLQKQIDITLKYVKPLLPLANCHMVEFLTCNYWDNFVPKAIKEEVDKFGPEKAIKIIEDTRRILYLRKFDSTNDFIHDERSEFKNLINFVEESDKVYLKPDGVLCLTVDQLKECFKDMGASNVDSLRIDEFMSSKKSHEVEVLSSMVAMLASCCKVDYTIELGGGRGFLATMLNMVYDMPVLNIDCAESNARGADRRNKKMQKKWPTLKKKATEDKTQNSSIEKLPENSEKQNNEEITENLPSPSGFNLEKSVEFTLFNNNLRDDDLSSGVEQLSLHSIDNKKCDKLYRHVTEFVTSETDLMKHVKCEFSNHSSDIKLCLTGLHTCGDLGSATVKLFTNSPETSLLCTVPCCYHLLTEQTCGDHLSNAQESLESTDAGFPMSNYLKGVLIGRNARSLASQSIERFFHSPQLPSDSLFYRSLLQVLLKQFKYDSLPERKLKGIASKCADFSEYFKLATKKLNVDPSPMNLSDEELNSFEASHENEKNKLHLFYLLKMCVAPVVESVVLLDRLMCLAENGFAGEIGDSYLVKIFDPVVSPRCHALVAYRKRYIVSKS